MSHQLESEVSISDEFHLDQSEHQIQDLNQIPLQTEDFYNVSEEGDTHLNYKTETGVILYDVEDSHHVPTQHESAKKRMSFTTQQQPLVEIFNQLELIPEV